MLSDQLEELSHDANGGTTPHEPCGARLDAHEDLTIGLIANLYRHRSGDPPDTWLENGAEGLAAVLLGVPIGGLRKNVAHRGDDSVASGM